MNQLDLNQRHAVITGGASGLGFAIAQRVLASGGRVTLWDRNEVALKEAQGQLGAQCATVVVDITLQHSIKMLQQ